MNLYDKKILCGRNLPACDKIKLLIASQCAPVLLGIKASNLITLSGEGISLGKSLLGALPFESFPLYEDERQCVLLVYNSARMNGYIRRSDCAGFLRESGYGDLTGNRMLMRLKARFTRYYVGQGEFPHELGIFLEYPPGDVRGFIENKGKNSLVTGYWKVYGNREQAERTFQEYDRARTLMLRGLSQGRELWELTKNGQQRACCI